MPVRPLPEKPSLVHLKHQAKDLLRDHAAHDPAAAQRMREFHPRFADFTDAEIFAAPLRLADAQLTIARESGFPSWARLKRRVEKPAPSDQLSLPHHERIDDPTFRHAVDLLDSGDIGGLRSFLEQHPGLVHQRVVFEGGNYFRNPALLEFVAENPIRHGKLPPNIAAVAKVILDAGAEPAAMNETLGLVATGRVSRECGVQLALIGLLCDHGADPNGGIRGAILHGEFDAVHELMRRGARVDLPVAAALGRIGDFRRLLPNADGRERHLALAVAVGRNQIEIVRLLLDAGEDPNRYNPPGAHAHSTPLHQAAFGGHQELVQLLIERGARVDLKDIMWHGTPADWARHGGKKEVEEYLRSVSGSEPRSLG